MPSLFSERISEASFMLSVSLDGDEVDILVDTKFLGITPVYSGKDPNIDIVAVPGLGSHAFGTWKGDSHEMWLRDFLPKEPVLKDRLRVLIFGYDSALQKNSSTNSFGDYARNMLCVLNVFRSHEKERNRPLIFVCHCLGGILVKTVSSTRSKSAPRKSSLISTRYCAMQLMALMEIERYSSLVLGYSFSVYQTRVLIMQTCVVGEKLEQHA
ncbi:Similar to conserved hypothetical protein [Coccidioides posadasii str. Silveira]; acc. no. EFW19761 [Pyronema omphalodes CBS 100304]|uniref:Uncharacterized protein n=1 Tax=Pyronema omphalodes (strain CBS 100304) TaxID=1076935 RepID=U4L240_PYROM|nr:Similar to conserved hypothetical protein [Coccidioides posadasii str. Silveira]; acc. no. EFW19761 [Pyronema omphalodes CBS 100304]